MPTSVLLKTGFACYFTHPISSLSGAIVFMKFVAKTTGTSCRSSVFFYYYYFPPKAVPPFLPTTMFPSQLAKALLGRITHRDIFKMDVGHVVVGAALPGVIEPEGQGTRVPTVKGSKFPEGAVLDVDRAIVELDPSNGKVPKTHLEETERHNHDMSMKLRIHSRHGQSHST